MSKENIDELCKKICKAECKIKEDYINTWVKHYIPEFESLSIEEKREALENKHIRIRVQSIQMSEVIWLESTLNNEILSEKMTVTTEHGGYENRYEFRTKGEYKDLM